LKGSEWFKGESKKPVLVSLRPEGMELQSEHQIEKFKPKYNFKEEQEKREKQHTIAEVEVFNQFEAQVGQWAEKEEPQDPEDDDWD
jgi:hypothetical protein